MRELSRTCLGVCPRRDAEEAKGVRPLESRTKGPSLVRVLQCSTKHVLAKSERVSGVGERPATNSRREIFEEFGVATVKGTLAIRVARLFAEPCRSDGLGRSARHITGLLPWVRRAGDNECPLVRRGGERSSAHANNACAPGSGRHRRNQPAKAIGDASFTRSRGPRSRQASRKRHHVGRHVNFGQTCSRRRNRGRRGGNDGRSSAAHSAEAGLGPRPREDIESSSLTARTSCFVAEVVRRCLTSDKPACPASKKGHRRR